MKYTKWLITFRTNVSEIHVLSGAVAWTKEKNGHDYVSVAIIQTNTFHQIICVAKINKEYI